MNHAGEIEAFATACAARLPLRLRVTDERSGQSEEVVVNRPLAIIGSSELCDVRLVHPDVSRHHAYIQILEGRPLCCDLGSRTGTHWGTAIRSRSWMVLGEPMYIGPFSIRLVDDQVDPPSDEMPVALAVDRPLRAPQPNMMLTFLNARSRSGRTRISRVRNPITLVGWSHLCNLRLQHHSVGRVHCSLVWTATGLWAVDLLCQGGTRVNGELINFARLDDEDDLTLGKFQLKIAYGSSAEMPVFSPSDLPEASPIADLPRLVPPGKFKPARLPAPKEKTPELESEPVAVTGLTIHDAGRDSDDLPLEISQRLRGEAPQDLGRPIPSIPMPAPQFVAPAQFGMPAQLGEGAPLNEAMAVSLMQQFATMQQQLFDHTHQLLAVMAETFQSAHNRQTQLIREELQRVHELNRELHELNRKKGVAEVGPEGMAAASGEQAVLLAVEELRQQTAEDPLTLDTEEAPPAKAEVPRMAPVGREKAPPAARPEREPETAPTDRTVPPGTATETEAEKPVSPTSAARAGATPEKPLAPAETANGSEGKDMHAWLSGRINGLERERSSRWQRILQLLTQGSG